MEAPGSISAPRFQYYETQAGAAPLAENHCHTDFELIGVLEGDITLTLEGATYRCASGGALLVPPLSYHSVVTNLHATYRRVTVLFPPAAIPEPIRYELLTQSSASPLFRQKELGGLLSALARTLSAEDSGRYAPLNESLFVQLLYCCAQPRKAAPPKEVDQPLQKLVHYIDAHLGEKLPLSKVAGALYLSQSTVCHLFQEKLHISAKQYILQKKMALAANLIRDGVPAGEAARAVGYDNYSNFFRMYKKAFGCSPIPRERAVAKNGT